MASKENKHKYADEDKEESPQESTAMTMTIMATRTHPHQGRRSLLRRNLPGEPALTMMTPPTWRMTPSETSTGATTTVIISSPMMPLIS
jgi:hypothetical protein